MHGFLICVTIKADSERARCKTWLGVYWIYSKPKQDKTKRKPFYLLKLILNKLKFVLSVYNRVAMRTDLQMCLKNIWLLNQASALL